MLGNTSRVVIDLSALASNYRYLSTRSHRRCAGVVKANGYGLGIEPVVGALLAADCRDIFVATLAEALHLRMLFSDLRIIALGGLQDAAAAAAAAHANIEPVINSAAQAQLWAPYAKQPVTLHVDTGMQRIGCSADDLAAVDWQDFSIATLMTHLACADVPEDPMNQRQLDRFERVRRMFPGVPTSIANSAGCLLPEAWHGDLTRPGIGLYGGHPQNRIDDNPLTPVAHMLGQILSRRTIEAGTPVGYGGAFVAKRTTHLAVVGLGYADGLPRAVSGSTQKRSCQVSWQGHRAPIVGRISMDLTHVDITDLLELSKTSSPSPPSPQEGDWVEFLGSDIGVDEVAQWAGTIGLEILCGLGRRAHWEYRPYEER